MGGLGDLDLNSALLTFYKYNLNCIGCQIKINICEFYADTLIHWQLEVQEGDAQENGGGLGRESFR